MTIEIVNNIRAENGFKYYVDYVTAHPTKPRTVEIYVVILDNVNNNVIPFSIPLEQSSITIPGAEKHIATLPWAIYGQLIDKPTE